MRPRPARGRRRSDTVGIVADRRTLRLTLVAAVLADIPPTPPYFARMKRINKEGPPLVDPARQLPALRPAAAAALAADGALIIDLRPGAAFAEGLGVLAVVVGILAIFLGGGA